MTKITMTVKLDDLLVRRAVELRIDLSVAAAAGVAAAVRRAESDRAAYLRHPERAEPW